MKNAGSRLKTLAHKFWRGRVMGPALLVAAVCAGCGAGPKTHYYMFRAPVAPQAPRTRTNLVLQVQPFDAPGLYRDDRIIYYTSPTELNFYDYHRWSSSPAQLLTNLAEKYFAETGLFKQVYPYPAPVHADYTLRGRVLDLAQMDYEKGKTDKAGNARVGLALDLIDTEDNHVVWSMRKEGEVAIRKKGVPAVVNALNAASRQILTEAYSSMAGVVENEFAHKQSQSH